MNLDTHRGPDLVPDHGRSSGPARRYVLALAACGLLGGIGPAAVADPAVPFGAAPLVSASNATGPDAADGPPTRAGRVPPLERGLDDLGVLAPFDPPDHDWLPGHRGVDLEASPGETVRSPAPGVVTFAGPVAGRDVLVVAHDDGLRTSLEPVAGSVEPGTRVGAGAAVGTVQDTAADGVHGGHCAAVCVHWGVRRGERYVDPLALLGERPPIVLLPLW